MPANFSQGIRPENIHDLVENTLHLYERNVWTDISMPLQQYVAMSNSILGKRVSVSGGDQLQWQIKVRNTAGAKNTALYATDEVNVADTTKHALLDWTFQTVNFSYDSFEKCFNQGPARILDFLKTRMHDALSSLAELMEDNLWGMPADDTTESEKLKPKGIPYWIVPNATKGFNGSVPTGHTNVAGLSPTAYPNWRNWTDTYKAFTKKDLIKKMREAHVRTGFKEPVDHPGKINGRSYRICTTYEVIGELETILEQQNENLGNDIASKDGQVMFRRTPVTWIPYLDENAGAATVHKANPIYGIDLNQFSCVVQDGKFMVRTKPEKVSNQHRVRAVFYDSIMQYRCKNRRSNFMLYQA